MAIWPEAPSGGAAPARDSGDLEPAAGWPPGSPFAAGTRVPRRGQPERRPRSSRLVLAALAAALAGLAASVAGVVIQVLPRTFSAAQQHQILAWEISGRWRDWPAGRIFPAAVRYQLPGNALAAVSSLSLTAHRVGLAPQADCRRATDPAVARVLTAHGCLAVLRATYDDATGSMAVTVGVAVFPDAAAEQAAARALPAGALPGGTMFAPGVRAVRFRGSAAALFGPAQRQLSWASSRGPYLVMAAAGYADGRPRVRESADPYATTEMRSLAEGVAGRVMSAITMPPPPPHCPGAPGC